MRCTLLHKNNAGRMVAQQVSQIGTYVSKFSPLEPALKEFINSLLVYLFSNISEVTKYTFELLLPIKRTYTSKAPTSTCVCV